MADPRPDGQEVADRLLPAQLALGQRRRQFQQRKRAAARLARELLDDAGCQTCDATGGQQRRGRPVVDAAQPDRLEPAGTEHAVVAASADEHRHALGGQPARGEQQRVRRRAVDPLRVVDEHEQRRILAGGRQQRQRRGADQKAVPGRTRTDAERRFKRLSLALRKRGDVIEQWPADVEKRGKLELCLGLEPDRAHHRALRLRGRMVQQRGLANARLAEQDKDLRLSGASTTEQPVKTRALAVPADQHHANLPRGQRSG